MNKCDKEMQRLIKKEGLDNPSVFFTNYETYEEIPLFSRYKNISFLSSLSFNDKNKVLIRKGIDLIANCELMSANYIGSETIDDYFICLSLTDWEDYEEINCLTPNIFISRRKKWLLSNLGLRSSQTIEENIVREYLFSLEVPNYNVCISNSFSENKRIYIVRNPV